ncbi:MAG: heme-binding domain-containing protein [Bacteroidetes bacterium]|nr:heme-binding domain-containing protein [Bacteroidota bacterium]
MKLKYKILTGVVVVFAVMQLFRIDKNNPEADPSINFISVLNPPQEISRIMKSSCYDCHSFETRYPWYSNIAPISWWLKGHVNHARDELNFSVWGNYSIDRKDHKLEEMVEKLNEGSMPLPSYLILHQHAKLDDQQLDKFVNWIQNYRQEIQ